ncbi:TBC domain-containing protein [Coniochaeta sp. PMI_546]|nr:TBC domain-containing protein [Coniochaeta sp. PMI_546]
MMVYEHAVDDSSPGSPPDLSESKSSHSSSFNSLGSNDNTDLADVGNFEDITLDDSDHHDASRISDQQFKTVAVSPYSPAFPSDLRQLRHKAASVPRAPYTRDLSSTPASRDVLAVPKSRPTLPTLKTHIHGVNVRTTSLALLPEPYVKPLPRRNLGARSSASISLQRQRSKSPNLHLDPRDPKLLPRPRRSSWQSNRRKSAFELELECDEDDGDDIPDGLVLDNVPISPRPPQERAKSQPASKSPSPERPKERVRSVGNGTPPVAVARGSLRSPMWKSDTAVSTLKSPASGPSPIATRAKSWTAALAELNADAKALTEKLEEHAGEMEHKAQRSSTGSMPNPRKSPDHDSKPRVRSALPELPPLRRTNIMIDPLPISKEKEAVLSRTRPSWLPPKDPVEERRHLKEYQKMMERSVEAERRRDADKRVRSEHRDQAADGLQHIWEEDILPRWNAAIRERRTRELWWRGVAPRSRGQVWSRAIGNELGLNETSYQAALRRAHEVDARVSAGNGSAEDARQAAWFAAIRKDVEERTWKDLRIFQAGAPLHQGLVDVLSAYAMYRSDIGYVTGCNTIAALLLLNLPSPAATFTALANVLNRPLPLSFYVSDPGAKVSAYNLLLQTLSHKSPGLHEHLTRLPDHDPDIYLCEVFTSLFTEHLALDEAARLWDVYVFEGDAILVRAAVALLLRQEMSLLSAKTMAEVRAVLETTSADGTTKTPVVVARNGADDRWIRAVREAGKA